MPVLSIPAAKGPALGQRGKRRQGVLTLALVLLALQVAHAVVLTVAVPRVGAVHRVLAEDDCSSLAPRLDQGRAWSILTVPRILQHAPAEVVLQVRLNQPLAVAHVVLLRPASYCLPAHRKLRAAGDADVVRHRHAGEQLLEGGLVDVLRVDGLVLLRRGLVERGTDLGGTAQDPDAAQVDVTLLLEVSPLETVEERQGVVVGVVVVPLEALGVVEGDVPGESVVAVDDVSVGSWLGGCGRCRASRGWVTYVRNTMASLPLLTGTVNSAVGSSTT